MRGETFVEFKLVREEVFGTVHGTVRGRDEDDQSGGFEAVQFGRWEWGDVELF